MRFLRCLLLTAVWLLVAAATAAPAVANAALPTLGPEPSRWPAVSPPASPSPAATPSSPPPPSPVPTPTPTPTPTPSPVNAQVNVSPVSSASGTTATVTGTRFLANEKITVLWDGSKDKVLATATADAQGNFKVDVKLPDDQPGTHKICVPEQPNPFCAEFHLDAAPSPSPDPTPTPSPTPSPSPSASPAALGRGGDSSGGGLGILLRPPFVYFPILLLVGLIGAFAYWVISSRRRPPRLGATVVHRSSRPEFGGQPLWTPPQAPVGPGPEPDSAAPPAEPIRPPPPSTREPRRLRDDDPPDFPIPSD